LPLLRLQGERIYQNQGVFDVVSPNMFAGSILDLEPDTAYEARFVMSDPDGFLGQNGKTVTKTVTVRTRPEPKPFAGGRVFHVYPTAYKGAKIEPAFDAVMCAYNYYCGGGDTVTAGRPRVKPGDIILVHAGLYKYHPEYYTGDRSINATTPYEGTYYLTASGTADKPIVIKGAGDGEVIFDGNGNFNLFNVKAANYNYFEGVTIRNTDIAIWAGTQFIAGSKGLTVKKCRFENVGFGVFTNYAGSSDFYVADSYFIGRDDPNHLSDGSETSGPNSTESTVRNSRRPSRRIRPSGFTDLVTSLRTTMSLISTTESTLRRMETRPASTLSTAPTTRLRSTGTGGWL